MTEWVPPLEARETWQELLNEAQREVYRQRLTKALRLLKRGQKIFKRTTRGPVPLAFSQIMFWVAELRAPGVGVYYVPDLLELEGALDRRALAASLAAVADRHEILRTAFEVIGEHPCQVVHDKVEIATPGVDLSGLREPHRRREAARLVRISARRPMALDTAPLWRVLVLRLGERRHQLLLTFHHLILDGWGMGVFYRELAELYSAFHDRRPPRLAEVPVQYADYTLWLFARTKERAFDTELSYWFGRFEGGLPWLRLPTDRLRPVPLAHRGGFRFMSLPPSFSEALEALGRAGQSSKFILLLSALKALLARYASHDQVMVGTPVANRDQRQLEDMLGCTINLLLLRSDLAGDPTLSELVARVRETAIGAFSHQELSFVQLKMEYAKEVTVPLDRPPFQVLFTYLNTPHSFELPMSGLTASRPHAVDRRLADRELTLGITENARGMAVSMHYLADLFDACTVDRMLRHWRLALEQILAAPERSLSALPLLSDGERHQILVEWRYEEAPREAPDAMSGSLGRVLDAWGQPTPINAVGELFVVPVDGEPRATGRTACLRVDGRLELIADPLADAPRVLPGPEAAREGR